MVSCRKKLSESIVCNIFGIRIGTTCANIFEIIIGSLIRSASSFGTIVRNTFYKHLEFISDNELDSMTVEELEALDRYLNRRSKRSN